MLKTLLFIFFLSANVSYALILPDQCGAIDINNNTEKTLEISGIYPDSEEALKPFIIDPYMTQQHLSLGTVRSCAGNTRKIHCNAMWIHCHKTINLTIKVLDTGKTSFSAILKANDFLSVNTPLHSDEAPVILINDIPQ